MPEPAGDGALRSEHMITFTELAKAAESDLSGLPCVRLAVLGDCSTWHLCRALRGAAAGEGIRLEIYEADYDQIREQTLSPDSDLYAFHPEFVLIFMCAEKLYEKFVRTPLGEREAFARKTAEEITEIWERIKKYSSASLLQYDFVSLDDGVFGSCALKTESSFPWQERKLNLLLMEEAVSHPGVYLLGLDGIQSRLGRERFFDPRFYHASRLPVSFFALPDTAALALDMMLAIRGRIRKCIILDLDNTLWGGTLAEDGLSGIQIGELGSGRAFTDLQRWLLELKNRGILLAVCSKNDEEKAKEPFIRHPEMVLRLEDISLFVANWEDKATNIRTIARTLNLGLESLVFLDDSSFERNLVRSLLPEVTVPELPADPAEVLPYLRSLRLFETASYSTEDALRTEQYRTEAMRTVHQAQFQSLEDYLRDLDMKAAVMPFTPFYFPRIAQLTQRSNQFNLRTVRRTEEEIARIAADDHYITLAFFLSDRFGDYGLVSAVILEKQGDSLFVETWLMSCRVLKRGMEEFTLNRIMETARRYGYKKVVGEYIRTPKNAMVEGIYEKLGFKPLGNNLYSGDTETFKPNSTFIREENPDDRKGSHEESAGHLSGPV